MPSEPFLKAHRKRIDVLVHLLYECNGLSNWFVLSIDVSGTFRSGKRVTKTKLGLLHVVISQAYPQQSIS